MSLSNYLNKTNFYLYSGLSSSDVNDSYVDLLISNFNKVINQKLRKLFTLSSGQVAKYYAANSKEIIIIGNWQQGGGVGSITIANGGSAYSSTPTISITGDGEGATAEAEVTSGVITAINLTNVGQNYTTAAIVISDTTGTAATATASIIPNLIVKRGVDNFVPDTETLTESNDYKVIFFDILNDPYRTMPIVAIQLYYRGLYSPREYLQIEGTYGFMPSVPAELMLDIKMYDLLKKAALSAQDETNTGGKGSISTAVIDKISVSYDFRSKITSVQAISGATKILDSIVGKYELDPGMYTTVIG